jgi:hypothetical protein
MKKLAAVFLSLFFFVTCSRQVANTTDETVTGIKAMIQYEDGTPVNGATVKVFEVSDSTRTPASVSVTDATGKYIIDSLPKGTYNIWAQKDTLVSFQDSVYISANSTIGEGTVLPEGSFTGIIGMQPSDDPRSAYVQILGSEKFSNIVNIDGSFTLNGLATGNYNLRIWTTKLNYTPTFFQVAARSGYHVTLKDTLWLIYTGIPVVTGLKATYDTLNGLVRLSWNKPAFRDLQDFVIYKDLFTSTGRTKLPFVILDTFFVDTVYKVFNTGPVYSQYFFFDTNDCHLKYRVAARNNSDQEGETYKFVDIVAVSPTRVQTAFYSTVFHIGKGFLTDSASINDSLRYIVLLYNQTRALRRITWTDLSKNSMVRSKSLDTTSGYAPDTLKYSWATMGKKGLECAVTDMAGTVQKDTVFVSIVKDDPTDSLAATPEVIARTDTIRLHADAYDKFGRIVKYEWDLGNTGTFASGNSDTFYIAPNEFTSIGFSVRVTDDDGNSVIDTITKQISLKFQEATANAGYPLRVGNTCLAFNDKMWVIGGYNGRKYMNDVWYSTDGTTWSQATDSAGFSPRYGHSSVVFDNKMWVIGGSSNTISQNDVWYSTDGVTWKQATDAAAFPRCYGHSSVVFDNKMWVIGSGSVFVSKSYEYIGDAWYSFDGITWILATGSAGFPPRRNHTSVVFDNKIWIIAGKIDSISQKDVWYSTTGSNWNQATDDAAFGPRVITSSVVFDNKIWVIGGNYNPYSGWNGLQNDVWYSIDGSTWNRAIDSAPFSSRAYHTCVVFNNKIWVIGGYDGNGLKNDVWWSK